MRAKTTFEAGDTPRRKQSADKMKGTIIIGEDFNVIYFQFYFRPGHRLHRLIYDFSVNIDFLSREYGT